MTDEAAVEPAPLPQEAPVPDGRTLGEATSILQVRIAPGYQRNELTPQQRRAARMARRRSLRVPGLMPPVWALAAPMRYCVGSRDSGDCHVVPDGHVFDGASVPAPLTLLVPATHSGYIGAAALHDYLYAERPAGMTRARADDIFLEALMVSGLNWVWAGLMWRGVRAGGWPAWYRDQPDTLAGRALALPGLLRWPLYVGATLALGLWGALVVDLFRLGALRRRAAAIAAQDRAAEDGTVRAPSGI